MSLTTHMKHGFDIFRHPTYDEMQLASEYLAEQIDPQLDTIDVIVGISRGGLLTAVQISHLLQTPMVTVDYSSEKGAGESEHVNGVPQVTKQRILLVDDLCDTGNTMKELHEVYESRGHEVTSAVVYHKTFADQLYIPDFWAINISENFGWIHFPYEQG